MWSGSGFEDIVHMSHVEQTTSLCPYLGRVYQLLQNITVKGHNAVTQRAYNYSDNQTKREQPSLQSSFLPPVTPILAYILPRIKQMRL